MPASPRPIVITEANETGPSGVRVNITVQHLDGASGAALRALRAAVRDLEARLSRP